MIPEAEPLPAGSRWSVNLADLVLTPEGVLVWPARRTLVVADLHLGKGASLAGRGSLLPPYDTAATLARLKTVIATHAPDRVIALGDSFHDARAAGRLGDADRAVLRGLTGSVEWIWITGNHDETAPTGLGGRGMDAFTLGPLVFRHAARPDAVGEISGHWHPKARVRTRARTLSARCFVSDGARLVMPAFGAYTGGLDVHHRDIRALFPRGFTAHLLGRARIHAFPHDRLARPAAGGSRSPPA